jgi:hypothetical protein
VYRGGMDEVEAQPGTDGPGATPEGAAAAAAGVEPWTGVEVGVGGRVVAYLWEWAGDKPRRLRVLRSRRGFAAHADEAWQGVGGQFSVYEGEGTSLRDAGLAPRTVYCYTFFVRDDAGEWRELLRESVTTVAEDEKPKGRPLLHDGPSRADEVIGMGLGVVGLVLDAHTWLAP